MTCFNSFLLEMVAFHVRTAVMLLHISKRSRDSEIVFNSFGEVISWLVPAFGVNLEKTCNQTIYITPYDRKMCKN